MAEIPEGVHVGVIQLDERQRARLGRWVSRDPKIAGWRVYVADGGRTVRMEAQDGEG